MNTMNPVIFMPRVMPHIGGGGGNFTDLSPVLLTFAIVGVILYLLGIFVNILYVKFSQRSAHTPIHWADIEPRIDNTFLGCLCGVFGFVLVCAAVILGLFVGVHYCITAL